MPRCSFTTRAQKKTRMMRPITMRRTDLSLSPFINEIRDKFLIAPKDDDLVMWILLIQKDVDDRQESGWCYDEQIHHFKPPPKKAPPGTNTISITASRIVTSFHWQYFYYNSKPIVTSFYWLTQGQRFSVTPPHRNTQRRRDQEVGRQLPWFAGSPYEWHQRWWRLYRLAKLGGQRACIVVRGREGISKLSTGLESSFL